MELEKYVKATKEIIWNAYSEIEAALMERDTALENLKVSGWKFSEDGISKERESIISKFNTDTQTAVANCRAAIQKQKDGYMMEVHDYYTPDGSKIDLNLMNLIKAGFQMSIDELIELIEKYSDNPTMLRVIEKYAAEQKMIGELNKKSADYAVAFMKARNAGKAEEKIFDTFVHLSCEGMRHPDEHYTMFQSQLDGYEEDAVLSLLKAKIYKDDATQQRIDQIEAEQLQKHNDVRKGKFWKPEITITRKTFESRKNPW